MGIENIMYLALGVLVSGLLALAIMPAVWKRAVRLTKKRIEAATPMTMAEFRADKDQLRAEFALSTRRLEMSVEALRHRLAEQLNEINRKKTEVDRIIGERDTHLTIVRELEDREAELRRRILDLEREGADSAQRLRMRDREFAEKVAQLEAAREELRSNLPRSIDVDGKALSGDYNTDMDVLLGKLEIERRRAAFLETQNRALIAQVESTDKRVNEAAAAAAELRAALAKSNDAASHATTQMLSAEARIAEAENRVGTLIQETTRAVEDGEMKRTRLLAEKLSAEEELERLRVKVAAVESTVMADWDTDRVEQSHLRERLNDIASDVTRLVYAIEGQELPDSDESLLGRVEKFAADGLSHEAFAAQGAPQAAPGGTMAPHGDVSDRLAALRDIQTHT